MCDVSGWLKFDAVCKTAHSDVICERMHGDLFRGVSSLHVPCSVWFLSVFGFFHRSQHALICSLKQGIAAAL